MKRSIQHGRPVGASVPRGTRRAAWVLLLALLACRAIETGSPPGRDAVTTAITAGEATIGNARVRVVFDRSIGTYSAFDALCGEELFAGACLRATCAGAPELAANAADYQHDAAAQDIDDALGAGRKLVVHSTAPGKPGLLLEITLHDGSSAIVLAAGVDNVLDRPLQLLEFHPLAGARLFGGANLADAQTLNGPSGGRDTRVLREPFRTSPNNLLLTLGTGAARRTLVAGGLTYREFLKWAATSSSPVARSPQQLRRQQLAARAAPAGGELACYLDCGAADAEPGPSARLVPLTGKPWDFASNVAPPWSDTVLFDAREVLFEARDLDPRAHYTLGFSWWDHNNDGRTESVSLIAGEDGARTALVERALLPAYAGKGELAEEKVFAVPGSAYASGKLRLAFSLDRARPTSNAVVSEVWLWRGPPDLAAHLAPTPQPDAHAVYLDLKAADPVGKRVDPGARYLADDRFYVDGGTADPFTALEQYGLALRAAQGARPNPYDFPTECSWYAGVWKTQGAQNQPQQSRYQLATTKGLVEELDCIAQQGFLGYSRVALRLVPDNYTRDNMNGWWDDAHYRSAGFFVPPYASARTWGQAISARGGLPGFYIQPTQGGTNGISRDFRQAFPQLLLARDPERALDYTNPDTAAHMRAVYANLRSGGIATLMFDYCDDLWFRRSAGGKDAGWDGELARGGFADPYATAASAYRTMLQLAKDGLGPASWIHERAVDNPGSDIAVGIVDSQRTQWDSDRIDPALIARSGLRWYKNRVALAYDMDARDLLQGWQRPGFGGSERDGRRMLLTMCYVAASRLLLGNSFRDLSAEALFDLERTVPYHQAPQSARPIDAFVGHGWPSVYDFVISPRWHQLTLLDNSEPAVGTELSVPLSGAAIDGGLGLDPSKEYYFYDFWNQRFVGKLAGSETLRQVLRPGEARMLSVHEVEPDPQFLSTNRHLMQGYVDLVTVPRWEASSHTLRGTARVVGGESFEVVLATQGRRPLAASADGASASLREAPGGLWVLGLDRADNGDVPWQVTFAERIAGAESVGR